MEGNTENVRVKSKTRTRDILSRMISFNFKNNESGVDEKEIKVLRACIRELIKHVDNSYVTHVYGNDILYNYYPDNKYPHILGDSDADSNV